MTTTEKKVLKALEAARGVSIYNKRRQIGLFESGCILTRGVNRVAQLNRVRKIHAQLDEAIRLMRENATP